MATYIVTYDLKDDTKYDEVLKYLKQFPWARVSESSYCIVTNNACSQVVDALKRITANKIHVYVISVSSPYSGFGPPKVNEWLDGNLP